MKNDNLHSVGDKAIYDALCPKNKVTNDHLKELFLKRGIIVSPRTDRKQMASNFSNLVHDFEDFAMLSDVLGTSTQRERNTAFKVESKATKEDFKDAVSQLATELNESSDCIARVVSREFGIELSVEYKSFRPNRNEFSQYITRTAKFEIEQKGGEFSIRHPDNDMAGQWAERLVEVVGEDVEEVKKKEVTLSFISDVEIRSKFFERLIHNLDNYECVDVTDVYVYKPKMSYDDDYEAVLDERADSEISIVESSSHTHISSATLTGEGVLHSKELKDLYARGFYISKIVWTAKVKSHAISDLYVFQAGVSCPEDFSGFYYLYKGYYGFMSAGKYTVNTKTPDSAGERLVNNSIEEAAHLTVSEIQEKTTILEP